MIDIFSTAYLGYLPFTYNINIFKAIYIPSIHTQNDYVTHYLPSLYWDLMAFSTFSCPFCLPRKISAESQFDSTPPKECFVFILTEIVESTEPAYL
jgi:hypothetical protein